MKYKLYVVEVILHSKQIVRSMKMVLRICFSLHIFLNKSSYDLHLQQYAQGISIYVLFLLYDRNKPYKIVDRTDNICLVYLILRVSVVSSTLKIMNY